MQLNRYPVVYDVVVKNNSKEEEKSLTVLKWNTESTLWLLFVISFYAPLYYLLLVCMFQSYISLKFLTYKCLNYNLFYIILKVLNYLCKDM